MMKILVTGSAGRIGRAIYTKLMRTHDVVGIDKTPCSTVDFVGDIRDTDLITQALNGIDVVIHTAALHAPHVGIMSHDEFQSINVDATEQLALQAIRKGGREKAREEERNSIKHFIFTSTTALYGYASTLEGETSWITEQVKPQPKSIYHKSKILAEAKLQAISNQHQLPVTVLQISRCFPEPANEMAIYRLNRGIDARDVATAHLCALEKRLDGFNRFIISGKTPFTPSDTKRLYRNADALIKEKCPQIALAFEQRGWSLPSSLDRIYDSSAAQRQLNWHPKHGFESVLEMLDKEISEVLPTLTCST